MSKQENYLDELLNSVNRSEKQKELMEADPEFLRELKGAISAETAESASEMKNVEEPISKKTISEESILEESISEDSLLDDSVLEAALFADTGKTSAKAEAEFIMEFEKELAGEDYEEVFKEFEEPEIEPEDRLEDEDVQLTDEDALLSILGESSFRDEDAEEPDLSKDYDIAPADAIDLSQMGEEDLINLLAGTDNLADIGELLSKSDSDIPVGEEDAFAAFAESEMAGPAESAVTGNSDSKEKKKQGFFDKFKEMIFGKDEEDVPAPEPVNISVGEAPGVEFLSDENDEILKAFAEVDRAEAAEKETEKGKKKGKKDKKKEPKAKKPAKPKAPKKEKVKKPKEVDNTPPLPKIPVVLVCVLMVSIFVLVFFGSEIIGYSMAVSSAKKLYKEGFYSQAAKELNGLEIKDEDMMLHGKIATLAAVHSEKVAYKTFKNNGYEAEALDCLISAAGRVEVNVDNTLTFDCEGEMTILKEGIIADLKEDYQMTYEEALELYELTERDRDAYTIALREVMDRLGIEWE